MRRLSRFSVASIGVVACSMIGIGAVQAASGEESSFVSRINGERSSRGTHGLQWREDLAQVARRHSRRMADQNHLHHNPNLRNEVSGWEVVGENVGYGPSVDDLHQAFMNSAGHRANILDRDYTHVGVGTVWSDGTLWVTEVFMRPRGGSSGGSRPTASKPKPRPRPKPVRRVEPATPPRRSPAVPPPPAPAPAPVPAAPGLTELMMRNVLEDHEPAAGSIVPAELLFVPVRAADERDIARLAFLPFAQIAGRAGRDRT